jgi:hypothetical protein
MLIRVDADQVLMLIRFDADCGAADRGRWADGSGSALLSWGESFPPVRESHRLVTARSSSVRSCCPVGVPSIVEA